MAVRITRMTKRRLGELLRAEGLVTEEQVKLALAEQRKANLFLGEALVKLGYVTEDAIAATLAHQFSLPFLSTEQYTIPKEVLDVFPESMLWEYQFVPLDKIGNQLVILGAGLMNHDVLAELERIGACKICQYIGTWNDIKAAIDRLYKDRPKPAEQLTSVGQMLLQEGARAPQATPGGEAALAAPKEVLATPEMARSMAGGAGPAAPPVPARAASPPPSEPVSEPVTAAAAPLPLVAPPPPPAPVTAAGGESAPAPPASRFGSGRLSAFARPAAAAKPAPEAAAEAEKKAEPEGQDEKKKEPAARAPKAPKGGLIKFLKT